MSRVRSVLLAGALAAGLTVGATPARAADPGPPLTVTPAQFDRAFECSGPLAGLTRDPVLLTPAFSTAKESYGWNYRRELPKAGITTCTLNLPDRGFGDLQNAAEYVVLAVRRMAAERGGKIALMGHQHGALDELWALRFWPDLAGKVSDYVSLATPYRGTTTAADGCRSSKSCSPAAWQISTGSRFLEALRAAPVPAGPAYTSISTAFDELILPQPSTSRLDGASNVVIQDICPLRPIEHFTILADAITYRLVLDALGNAGPAKPSRIPRTACFGPLYLPGFFTPGGLLNTLQSGAGAIGGAISSGSQSVGAEPTLRSYAAAS